MRLESMLYKMFCKSRQKSTLHTRNIMSGEGCGQCSTQTVAAAAAAAAVILKLYLLITGRPSFPPAPPPICNHTLLRESRVTHFIPSKPGCAPPEGDPSTGQVLGGQTRSTSNSKVHPPQATGVTAGGLVDKLQQPYTASAEAVVLAIRRRHNRRTTHVGRISAAPSRVPK